MLSVIRRCSTSAASKPAVYSHRSGAKTKAKKSTSFSLKTPRGTRDFCPAEVIHREATISAIKSIFTNHGGEPIDTPVFELTDVLLGKYGGEASKLIYDLGAEDGGEKYSLRYDVTVPFARFLGANRISKMKRFQIGKVYRREQPVVQRGRFCEFYQCDFDIAGDYPKMVADAECLKIVDEVVKKLNLGPFTTRVNHRSLLGGVLIHCGVPQEATMSVCSSIDKLDKESWNFVAEELQTKKNIPSHVISQLEKFVRFQGDSKDTLQMLEGEIKSPQVGESIADLNLLFSYCNAFQIAPSFDLSLARGLDYYTGMIFETVLTEDDLKTGSIAAGGRYDNLVESLTSRTKKPFSVPCVGLSIGIERIFALLQKRQENPKTITTEVFVASPQKNLLKERMAVCGKLWNAGISAQFEYKNNSKILDQLQFCEANAVKYVVIVGAQEAAEGVVKLKNMATREETVVKEEDIVEETRKRIC
ncbi:hypothetical protein L596_028922 [Steinernema carpocapsae]|uniref:histidine--tRNA ligase n=1 Tax=Steinernema carpocapsae TaxID=34508 RepID=A0A4U5LZT2_STECR|nr:hypothetical protein L596_028922 [Steinernema carpocapsae]